MPYKYDTDKLKIEEKDDRRCKLTKEQREEIKKVYGTISQRKLAEAYGVSRRLIQFIGDPEKHQKNLEARELRGGSKQYYNKATWNDTMRDHREHKYNLYKQGKLIKKEETQ